MIGAVTARVELVPADGGAPEVIEARVDAGATLSSFPGPTLDRLGVERIGKVTLRLADGRRIERDVGNAQMRLGGQTVWSRVIFGEAGDAALLGLTVLEQLGLTVDPIERRLVPAEFTLY